MKKNWKDIALEATRGTKTGAILRCFLGRNGDEAPRFEGKACITSDGFIMANFVDRHGGVHLGAFVGSAEDFFDNVRGLSEHLGLDHKERAELSSAALNWIAADYRTQIRNHRRAH